MELALERLSDNLNNKFEDLIIINSSSSHIREIFNQPIILDPKRKYKMGLSYFSVYNSIRNITELNNKIDISTDGVTFQTLTLPPGSYEIEDINIAIGSTGGMDAEGRRNIAFVPKVNLNKVELKLQNGRAVRFTNESFHHVLGFNQQIYNTTTTAPNRANIQNDINAIIIQCDKISGGYREGQKQNIIFSIPSFTVSIGERIIEKPFQTIYLPLNTDIINEINLYIKDQNGNLIDFGGEEISIQLHLKQI